MNCSFYLFCYLILHDLTYFGIKLYYIIVVEPIVVFANWVIFYALLLSADFFQNPFFLKILSQILSECQTVCIQIRPDVLSGLIWVQTVCKSYQQTTLVNKELTYLGIRIYYIIVIELDRPDAISGSKLLDTLMVFLK